MAGYVKFYISPDDIKYKLQEKYGDAEVVFTDVQKETDGTATITALVIEEPMTDKDVTLRREKI